MCYGVDWELPLNRCLYHPTDDTQGLSSSSTIGRSKRAPSLGGSAGAIQEVNLYSQLRMAARPVLAFARGSFRQPDNAEDRPSNRLTSSRYPATFSGGEKELRSALLRFGG